MIKNELRKKYNTPINKSEKSSSEKKLRNKTKKITARMLVTMMTTLIKSV
jgi:hypothetical protein